MAASRPPKSHQSKFPIIRIRLLFYILYGVLLFFLCRLSTSGGPRSTQRRAFPATVMSMQIYAYHVMSSRILTLHADEILEHANNALALIYERSSSMRERRLIFSGMPNRSLSSASMMALISRRLRACSMANLRLSRRCA